eukprot:366000-Chlamydomonas_euryale.AAC.48
MRATSVSSASSARSALPAEQRGSRVALHPCATRRGCYSVRQCISMHACMHAHTSCGSRLRAPACRRSPATALADRVSLLTVAVSGSLPTDAAMNGGASGHWLSLYRRLLRHVSNSMSCAFVSRQRVYKLRGQCREASATSLCDADTAHTTVAAYTAASPPLHTKTLCDSSAYTTESTSTQGGTIHPVLSARVRPHTPLQVPCKLFMPHLKTVQVLLRSKVVLAVTLEAHQHRAVGALSVNHDFAPAQCSAQTYRR